jgi:hypothetical protein
MCHLVRILCVRTVCMCGRDVKLDNVLCREEEGGELTVAFSDFGSCVAGELVLSYVTDQTAKGGQLGAHGSRGTDCVHFQK